MEIKLPENLPALAWMIEDSALYLGSCLGWLEQMPDNCIDSIVADPPYGTSFMSKKWDYELPAVEVWRECLRVLKPGGFLLSFGGCRTYHRLACNIEDAGFTLHPCLAWVFGTGFPKATNLGKQIDRRRYDIEQVYKVTAWIKSARDAAGIRNAEIDRAFGKNTMARHWTDVLPGGKQPTVPTLEQIPKLLKVLRNPEVPEEIQKLIIDLNGRKGQPGENWFNREVIGKRDGNLLAVAPGQDNDRSKTDLDITAHATVSAKKWDGFYYGLQTLKPALEPICMAQKPFDGRPVDSILKWGVGALNIDGCRIGTDENPTAKRRASGYTLNTEKAYDSEARGKICARNDPIKRSAPNASDGLGRWPANLMHDGSTEVIGLFPKAGKGSAARFFYQAKASKQDRAEGLDAMKNGHPTVKPVDLLRYLCRLITPPGGTVLDPYMGSGSTGKAARREGLAFIGIEREREYFDIAAQRIKTAKRGYAKVKIEALGQLSLF